MSEPVSKAEIEDVLSSIRRLVSENTGPIRREKTPEKGTERLVLTPAFRIDEESGEADDSAENDSPDSSADAAQPETAAVKAPILDAILPDEEDLALPDLDDVPQEAAAAPEPASGPDETTVAEEAPTEDASPQDEAPGEATKQHLNPLEQRIAELEAVVARSAAEFEPDGSESEDMPDAFVFQHRYDVRPTPKDTPPQAEPDAAEAEAEIAEEAPAAEAEPAAAMEEPKRDRIIEVIRAVPDMPTPAAEDDAAVEASEPAQAFEPEADEAPEPVADVADEIVTEDAEDLVSDEAWDEVEAAEHDDDGWEEVSPSARDDSNEAIIDEDALRELVAQLVREELQGSVGERITHNVRRMIRREIARALSLQGFE